MGLAAYRRKRNFSRTPEPDGGARAKAAAGDGRRYVIQKHAARRLHYDLRLEDGGVLRSWAVPKGPSLDPKQKRLAVEVEDHPLEYGSFEGVIPEGEYGAGRVLLWDTGRWVPQGDAALGFQKGHLKFRLEGEKLKGGWNLVRLRNRDEGAKPNWLLIKEDDDAAATQSARDILKERPESVATGKVLDDMTKGQEHVWHSNRPPAQAPGKSGSRPARAREHGTSRRAGGGWVEIAGEIEDLSRLAGAKKARLPDMIPFELATLVDEPPVGGDWVHEIKLDGFRMQCRIEKGRAQLLTRTGQDWTQRFRAVAEDAGRLAVHSALLDGELVALQPDGRSSFQLLQQALSEGADVPLVYYAFDLLHANGLDLLKAPLEERKAALSRLLSRGQATGAVRYSEHFAVEGRAFFDQACRLQLEGMISKRRAAPYRPGRGRDWLKVKCLQRQEFVVGGFTEPGGSRTGLGALLVGVHDGDRFLYAGRVGTGFNAKMLESLRKRLASLEQPHSPFHNKVPGPLRGIHWAAPQIVVEVAFTEWTSDGLLRHPSFQGIREDKKPSEVTRESAEPMETEMKHPPRARPQRSGKPVEIAGIRLSNPDKVLYPGDAITKLDLARYYESIADWILPHVAGRPLTIVRCPEGCHKPCFFQKHFNDTVPKEVRSLEIKEGDKKAPYLMIDDLPGLIALAQMGVLELHIWGSRAARLECPDRMVFDLDPDESLPWRRVVEAAQLVKDRLSAMDLQSWVKTTGGKGLHVVVPLSGKRSWDEVKAFSQAVAQGIARDAPDRYTSKMSKTGRAGKVFIDYLRNGRGATFVSAYSTRARRGATVSLPIRWDEAGKVEPARFTVKTVPSRLQRIAQDPWKDLWETRQQITRAAWKAAGLK